MTDERIAAMERDIVLLQWQVSELASAVDMLSRAIDEHSVMDAAKTTYTKAVE